MRVSALSGLSAPASIFPLRQKIWEFGIFSGRPVQTLGINFRPRPYDGSLTKTPRNRQGKFCAYPALAVSVAVIWSGTMR